jgi:hypothetical protein
VRCVDEGLARERFAQSIARIRGILPQAEVIVLSPALISFRRHGLEFAQARIAHDPRNFQEAKRRSLSGWGRKSACSLPRMKRSLPIWCGWRRPCAMQGWPEESCALWRMHPERWLESLVPAILLRSTGDCGRNRLRAGARVCRGRSSDD